MKWTNPGHQLDYVGEKYIKVNKLYIWGTNEYTKHHYDFLSWLGVENDFEISFVVDESDIIKNQSFCGKRVISLQTTLLNELRNTPDKAVVALFGRDMTSVPPLLEKNGNPYIFYLIPEINCRDNFIQNFICIWYMYKYNKLLSHATNFVCTSRCNLNCRCCLNFNQYYDYPIDVTFDAFKKHIDILFTKFDFLYTLHISGGEPTLAKELPKMIDYIQKNYKDKIFEFFIIINGTIVPNANLIESVKSMGGYFLIDDYTRTVSHTKINKIKNILDDQNVKYIINTVPSWFDLEPGTMNYLEFSEEKLESHKDGCQSYHQDCNDGRFYACPWQAYGHKAGVLPLDKDDYIEIANTSKMELLEFRQGYTKKGYVEFCKICRGAGFDTKLTVPALQIPPKKKRIQQQKVVKGLVSICVPIYNTDKYIGRCITSLLNQTYTNLEILLVDDGSTDESGAICDSMAADDSRIKVIHKANEGEISARNAALQAASGEFIMFIDSDDEYMQNAVQLLIDAINNKNVDLAVGGYLVRHGIKELFAIPHFKMSSASEVAYNQLIDGGLYGTPYIMSTVNAKLFRRSIIIERNITFDNTFLRGNDSVFITQYLWWTRYVYNICAPIYIYYKYDPSERKQGTLYEFPDVFYLNLYVYDQLLKLSKMSNDEFNQSVINEYRAWINGVIEAIPNEKYLNSGIIPYLKASAKVDLLWIAANLDLASSDYCNEKQIPIKQISYLIKHKMYTELYKLFAALAVVFNARQYSTEFVYRGIVIENIIDKCAHDDKLSLVYSNKYIGSRLYVYYINNIILDIIRKNKSIEYYKSKMEYIEKYWLTIERFKAIIHIIWNIKFKKIFIMNINLIKEKRKSKLWKMTKPLRVAIKTIINKQKL